jgi:hypothetical protein
MPRGRLGRVLWWTAVRHAAGRPPCVVQSVGVCMPIGCGVVLAPPRVNARSWREAAWPHGTGSERGGRLVSNCYRSARVYTETENVGRSELHECGVNLPIRGTPEGYTPYAYPEKVVHHARKVKKSAERGSTTHTSQHLYLQTEITSCFLIYIHSKPRSGSVSRTRATRAPAIATRYMHTTRTNDKTERNALHRLCCPLSLVSAISPHVHLRIRRVYACT